MPTPTEKKKPMKMKERGIRESIQGQPLKKKISYIWLYYKWWFIGTAAVLLVAGSWIRNIVTTHDPDLRIFVGMDYGLTQEEIDAIVGALEPLTEDVNEDGRLVVECSNVYLTEELTQTAPEVTMGNTTNFMVEMSLEPTRICLVNDYFFNMMTSPLEEDGDPDYSLLCDLGELLGGGYEGYSVPLADTPLYDWECFSELPGDLRVIFLNRAAEGDKKKDVRLQNVFDFSERVFVEIMTQEG